MAPEIRRGEIYDGRAVDIFSSGVVLFTMVSQFFPFNSAEKSDTNYNLIRKGLYKKFWAEASVTASNFTDEFKHLVFSMLINNPKERITIE